MPKNAPFEEINSELDVDIDYLTGDLIEECHSPLPEILGIPDDLNNKELIEKLQGQKQVLLNRIEKIDATITLLCETPNYSKIHALMNSET